MRLVIHGIVSFVLLSIMGCGAHVESNQEPDTDLFNGIDINKFSAHLTKEQAKKDLGFPLESFIIGNIANLLPIKGQRYLIEAAREIVESIPNAFFVFVGEGSARKELEDYANALQLSEKIIFLGR